MKRNHSIYINVFVIISVIAVLFVFPSTVKAALLISGVTPNIISNNHENIITISGNDFISGAVVSLDGYGALNTSYSSNTILTAVVPAGIPIGTYTLTVTNPDSLTASLTNAIIVTLDNPTATPSQTVEPPNNYERPVVVVDTYSLDQDTISPGDSFTLFITLYNAGQQYATNVVATFSSGELMPRETGGVVAVGEIAPGNHHEFGQPLFLSTDVWGPVASINMVVSYTNQAGTSYSETFTITLPVYHFYSPGATSTPTPTHSPTPLIKPQLVITSYKTDISPLQPGAQFKLAINIQNMGKSTAKRVTMIVGGGSSISSSEGGTQQPGGISGASGEFTNFAPIGASNVQSLGDFSSGNSISAFQPLIVNVNTAPGAYPLKISFVYIDEQNHTYVDDQIITLLVYRLPILEISLYQQVPALYAGQANTLPLQVVNLGRNSIVLGNMRVSGLSGQFSNNSILVGPLDPGGYFTLDATFIPELPGATELVVSIDYTNDFNQPQVITKTLTVDVMEQSIIETPTEGSQNGGANGIPPTSETFLQKVWRFILGLIGLDSGLSTGGSSNNNYPIKTNPTQQPIIIPVQPPLKGP
jgi:hypothetical protein